MTWIQILGWFLISSPFIAVFLFAWYQLGIKEAIGIYVLGGAIIGIIYLGVHLVRG